MIKFALSVAFVLVALATFSFGRKEETLKELIARTEASRPDLEARPLYGGGGPPEKSCHGSHESGPLGKSLAQTCKTL